jgi:hypothetical protein
MAEPAVNPGKWLRLTALGAAAQACWLPVARWADGVSWAGMRAHATSQHTCSHSTHALR